MSRPRISVDRKTGESLYDVFNDQGHALLLGVPHSEACRIIDEHQAEVMVAPQWEGDMRIVMARRDPSVLELCTNIAMTGGRLVVMCEVENLLLSRLTVGELFSRVRSQLVSAVEQVAVRAPGQLQMTQPVSVQMDVGVANPSISLLVHDSVSCLADMGKQLDRLRRIVERMIVGERVGVGR